MEELERVCEKMAEALRLYSKPAIFELHERTAGKLRVTKLVSHLEALSALLSYETWKKGKE
jgi:hypothetical protein